LSGSPAKVPRETILTAGASAMARRPSRLIFRSFAVFLAEEGRMAKRELIKTGADTRYVRRNTKGQFKESDDLGKSLAADRRQKAGTRVKSGQGDKGDRR